MNNRRLAAAVVLLPCWPFSPLSTLVYREIQRDTSGMGTAHAKIRLENPKRADLKPIAVESLAGTGSLFLCIPEEVRLQLQLEVTSQKKVTTADGKRCLCPYVGPVRIQFEN